METPYRVLIAEDVPADAELNEREIRQVLTPCIFKRVETEEDFLRAIDEFKPDLIISDYQMPTFDGLTALKLTLERTPLTPFILVTGSMNEDTAVDCMKTGATDYVVKEHLKKLGPAVIRALEEKKIRMERLAAREALKESEAELREAQRVANVGSWELNWKTGTVTWSEETYRIFRRDPALFTPTYSEHSQILTSSSKSRLDSVIDIILRTGEPFETDLELIHPDGTTGWINARGEIKLKDAVFTVLRGTALDITERKKAEDALRASEAELHDNYFIQSAINMILSESLINIPLEEILQKSLNMILSLPWIAFESIGSISLVEDESDVLVMKARCNITEQQKKLCARVPFGKCLCGKAAQTQKIQFADHIDERHEICYEGMYPHGHYSVPILFSGRTLGVLNIYLKEWHIRDNKDEEFLCTVADTLAGIIVRKQGEDEKEKLNSQLLQAQKMEAIGQLAGGIAHDFNNILTAMIGYAHIIKMKMKEDDPLRNYADQILSLSDKAANLTQSLLSFSRKRIMNPEPVTLNEVIKRIDHLLSRIIGEDIKLQTVLSEEDLIVMADSGQIEQVLMNLATNARDAMPKGGLLTIVTETLDIDEEFIKEHGFGKEGEYALISLTDTGAGMDRETREKIFEPFFTTKEVGKGTGLGLSMVYGIIKQHEGYINVYSEPGRGTTFRIYLPLIEAKVEEIKPEVIEPVERGTETVLLAEDEDAIREFIKKLLGEYGYKVITAASGQEAINEFKAHKDKIQLALLDVIMPNKNGKEAYEEIKKIRPDIKVLFMSGYPADIIHKHDIIEKGFAYIEKPASPTKLLRKIREVLGNEV